MANEEIKKDAELEGKELEGKKLEDEKTEDAAGGYYVGSDKYTMEQYNWAGVTWEHNFWSKDRYFIRGVQIDQSKAEKIVDKAYEVGRPLTDDELRLLFGIHV